MSTRITSAQLISNTYEAIPNTDPVEYKAVQTILIAIECDTIADLPNQLYHDDASATVTLAMTSTAHIIEDNTLYEMKSDGTWVIQDEASRMNVYTKDQTDQLLEDMADSQANVDLAQDARMNGIDDILSTLVDIKGKNYINVFDSYSGQTATINGVTWTVNNDGTVTANGTATANSFFYIIPNNSNIVYSEKPTMLTGCPAGGSETTYELQTVQVGNATHHDYGNGVEQYGGYSYRYVVLTVRNGYTASNLTFSPMVCDKDKYDLSPEFQAYTPTLAQLYQLVRSYHS